jgi:hypothetical protein
MSSADSANLGGKPASAYALADSVATTASNANLNNEISRAQLIEGNLAVDLASAQHGIQSEATRAIGAETAINNNVATLTAMITDLQAQINALRAASPALVAATATPASSPATSSAQPQTAQPQTVIRTPIDLTRPSRTAR